MNGIFFDNKISEHETLTLKVFIDESDQLVLEIKNWPNLEQFKFSNIDDIYKLSEELDSFADILSLKEAKKKEGGAGK